MEALLRGLARIDEQSSATLRLPLEEKLLLLPNSGIWNERWANNAELRPVAAQCRAWASALHRGERLASEDLIDYLTLSSKTDRVDVDDFILALEVHVKAYEVLHHCTDAFLVY